MDYRFAPDSGGNRKLDDDVGRLVSPYLMTGADEVDEGDADSEETEQTYDASTEAFPRRPAFDEDLASAKCRAHSTVLQLHEVLSRNFSQSTELKAMLDKAVEALSEPEPERLLIGMVGATDAGNRALVNALTDVNDLVKELSSRESVTSAPKIYTHKLLWRDDEPFAAEIVYYTSQKCRELLRLQIDAYEVFYFEDDETWSSETRSDYQKGCGHGASGFPNSVLF